MENSAPVQPVVEQTPQNKGFNPLWLLLAVAAILMIIGVIIYSQNQSEKTTKQQEIKQVQEIKGLEAELNNLEDGSSDTDLTALEKDLQNL